MSDNIVIKEITDKRNVYFSFNYNGKHSSSTIDHWLLTLNSTVNEDGTVRHDYSYLSEDKSLVIIMEATEFPGSKVVEWQIRFRNDGPKDSPILENILSLDMTIPFSRSATFEEPCVLYSKGATMPGDMENYLLQNITLRHGDQVHLNNSLGGKTMYSIPFFNIITGHKGWIGAVGWLGRWKISITRTTETEISVKAGLEKIHLSLHPGEEIRTPRILLLPWEGDFIDAHNVLRSHILKYHTPLYDGKPVVPPVSCGGWGGMKTQTSLHLIKQIADEDIGYENFWMDAGWYGEDREVDETQNLDTEDWYLYAGDWRINRIPHPNELRPISDAAHVEGMKYLIWFEPERAVSGTPVTKEHHDWFIGMKKFQWREKEYKNLLLDMGNPEARKWITECVSEHITRQGIDLIKHDCNLWPGEYWEHTDMPNRKGITEIRYVEGLLEFWDELRRRHPNLVIDIVQRGDLDTLSRGVDLIRSDNTVFPETDPIVNQVGTQGLAYWRPHFGTCIQSKPGDTYHFRSAFSPGLVFPLFNVTGTSAQVSINVPDDYPFDWARTMIAQLKRARPYFYGDYYPLTDCTLSPRQWFGYQFHSADLNEGMIMMMRRPQSPYLSAYFHLKGLKDGAVYDIEDADSGKISRVGGNSLIREGLQITIDTMPGSCLLFYRLI